MIKQDGYSYGFDPTACFACRAKCCTGESGYIYVNMAEIEALANFLEMDVSEFAQKYLFKKGYKFSIKEVKFGDSYECVFYNRELNICNVYEHRPKQCRTFPFWDYYKTRVDELKLECPGVIEL
jgi:Fe-S-cluster containining protein